jgi:hypothetical protein
MTTELIAKLTQDRGRASGTVRRGNHSCDPNLWWTDPYTLAARRDIAPGDEITNDYATSTGAAGFTMSCRCGTAMCRGIVTGEDWRRDDLQWHTAATGFLAYSNAYDPALDRRSHQS